MKHEPESFKKVQKFRSEVKKLTGKSIKIF
jgi:hypothetical protein